MRIKARALSTLLFGFFTLRGSGEPMRFFYPFGNYVHKLTCESKPTVERVELTSRENDTSEKPIKRKGILVRYPNAQANVVISHGFMCDKFDAGFLRSFFPRGKYNFLTFDFRAHGENRDGQLCTFGRDEAHDVIAAGNFFKSHPELSKLPTVGYGFSMGAVANIEGQAKDSSLFKGMVLDCPFDSTESVVKKALDGAKVSLFGYKMDLPGRSYLERYAFHPYVQTFVKLLLKTVAHMDAKNIQTFMHRFSPAQSVEKITIPCLFIHCKRDQRVPVEAIKTIFSKAQGPKKLWLTNGRAHFDSVFYNPEKYGKKVDSFIEKVIKGKLGKSATELIIEDVDDVDPDTLKDTHERT